MTGEELLVQLKIDTTPPMYKIIEHYNHLILSAQNPNEKANIFLTKFGCDPIANDRVARLTVVALIRELVTLRDKFKLEKALKAADKTVDYTFRLLGLVVPLQDKNFVPAKMKKTDANYKILTAMELFKKYNKKTPKECTAIIAKKLKIPYGTAYYYYRKISKA